MPNYTDQASALADKAFAEYNFGAGVIVTDSSGWEYRTPGHERTRVVYVETGNEDDGPVISSTLTFTVRFDPETGSLSEAHASDANGNVWGEMPKAQEPSTSEAAMKNYRVIGAHPNGNFFSIMAEAKNGLHAFGVAALLLKEADEDGDAEFFAAIPAETDFDFPGDSVVTLETVLDPEQADVFGLAEPETGEGGPSPGM